MLFGKAVNFEITEAVEVLRPFLSRSQLAVMLSGLKGEEALYFRILFKGHAQRVAAMPKTHEQDGLGDRAIVYLHYFLGGSDWYITEKDVDGGIEQAFGYAVLNGARDMAEIRAEWDRPYARLLKEAEK
ncbi:MAG: hypothetical protein LBS70_05335 [Candidatus Accumulibacter sp.]|jgi:hypothetical protein|nr:hypothetical protein [Accumulibacter sp.]